MSHDGTDRLSTNEQASETSRKIRDGASEGSETLADVAPSSEEYAAAFRRVDGITDGQIQILRLHYHAPHQTVTATQLAQWLGYAHYGAANSQYGRLAHLVGELLEYRPDAQHIGTLITFEKRKGEWHWLMRPEVAQALEILGWIEADVLLPEEILPSAALTLVEGAVRQVTVNAYERNCEARRLCIEHHGTSCCICGFSFEAMYGEVVDGFIHVHHVQPLSEIAGEYVVDPLEDLRPVCPNCHAVLHRRSPPYSIEEVKWFVTARSFDVRPPERAS